MPSLRVKVHLALIWMVLDPHLPTNFLTLSIRARRLSMEEEELRRIFTSSLSCSSKSLSRDVIFSHKIQRLKLYLLLLKNLIVSRFNGLISLLSKIGLMGGIFFFFLFSFSFCTDLNWVEGIRCSDTKLL